MSESAPAGRTSRKTSLLRWAGTLLAVALLVYLLASQGWGEFWDALRHISWGYFAGALVLLLLSRLSVSGRWYALLRSAGVPVTLRQAVRLTFAGLFSSNFLPTTVGGDVVRLAGGVQLGWDAGAATATLIMDRVIGSIGMAVMLPIGLPRLWSFAAAHPSTLAPISGGTSLAGAVLGVRLQAVWQKILGLVHRLIQTLISWLRHPLGLLHALAWTLLHQVFLFSATALLLRGLGEPVSFWLVGGVWCLSYYVTLLPISINGLGVQEVSIAYLFSNLAGVSIPAAGALALIMRLLYLLASLPGAFFVPALLRKQRQD